MHGQPAVHKQFSVSEVERYYAIYPLETSLALGKILRFLKRQLQKRRASRKLTS